MLLLKIGKKLSVQMVSKILYIMDFHFRGNDYGTFSVLTCFEALKYILKNSRKYPIRISRRQMKY